MSIQLLVWYIFYNNKREKRNEEILIRQVGIGVPLYMSGKLEMGSYPGMPLWNNQESHNGGGLKGNWKGRKIEVGERGRGADRRYHLQVHLAQPRDSAKTKQDSAVRKCERQ